METAPDILSQAQATLLHAAFLRRIEDEARDAAAHAGDARPALTQALTAYLLAAQRAHHKVASAELQQLADAGPAALSDAIAGLRRQYFNETQQQNIDAAAEKRRDTATVDALFDGADRLYIRPLDDGNKDIEQKISAFLADRGLTLENYRTGHATDGKQRYKIGRLLQEAKQDDLLEDFKSDERRNLDGLVVVISRNPTDIARMTAGRGWKSCMAPHKPEFKFVPEEIAFGTLVAYLASVNDPEINNPLARTVIRPFCKIEPEVELYKTYAGDGNNYHRLRQPLKCAFEKFKIDVKWALQGRPVGENDVLYMAENKVYGISRGILRHTVDVFTRQYLQAGLSQGEYVLPWQVYTDTLGRHARLTDGRAENLPDPHPAM